MFKCNNKVIKTLHFSHQLTLSKGNAFFLWSFNPFQPSVVFHIETSHLICTANQITGFYVKCNPGLKWVKSPNRKKTSCRASVNSLTLFFSMFPFDPSENIRKPKVFYDVFRGIKREHWEEKG